MQPSEQCLAVLKHYEGCKLTAYVCPAGVLTIGYGHTGPDVVKGMKITQARALELLQQDAQRFGKGVLACVKVSLAQREYDALVSFAFNLGLGALQESTLLRKLNVGNRPGAADQFLRWINAGGKVLPGLQKRRATERSLFLGLPYTLD